MNQSKPPLLQLSANSQIFPTWHPLPTTTAIVSRKLDRIPGVMLCTKLHTDISSSRWKVLEISPIQEEREISWSNLTSLFVTGHQVTTATSGLTKETRDKPRNRVVQLPIDSINKVTYRYFLPARKPVETAISRGDRRSSFFLPPAKRPESQGARCASAEPSTVCLANLLSPKSLIKLTTIIMEIFPNSSTWTS